MLFLKSGFAMGSKVLFKIIKGDIFKNERQIKGKQ